MSRYCVISPIYPPEPLVSGKTTSDVANALAERGDEVTVLTAFPNRPAGRLYPGWSRRLYFRQVNLNQTILRCFSLLSSKSRLHSRLAENISFGITSSLALLLSRRPDAIYANTWPIFAAGITTLVAKVRRIPLVISIQDIYPESLLSQGRIESNSRVVTALRWIDARIARSATAVIVISDTFAQVYRENRHVPVGRVYVVPNWGETTAHGTYEEGRALRAEVGIPSDAFLLVYGGNIGAAAGVEAIINALRAFCPVERPYLLIAGSGAQLEVCRRLAGEVDSERIRFYTPWPAEKTAVVYAAADALILPTRGAQSLASVPSKLISYMLASRPVVAQALPGSDTAATIERAQCGWVVLPGNEAALNEAIRRSRDATEVERTRLGEAGRTYALQHFAKEACLPQVIAILAQAARSRVLLKKEENA